MKKYIIFSIILVCLFTFNVKAQIRLSSPIERAVYQRDASGNANISFAGQVPQIPCGTGNFLRYSINRISLQNGSLNSAMSPFTTLPNDARGRFFFTSQLSTGWYSVTFQTYFNDDLVFTNSYKFGVGDVYIIAGQSNGQGVSTTIPSPTIPEWIVGNNDNWQCRKEFESRPTMNKIASTNRIGPAGTNGWCYGLVGNNISSNNQNMPVAFLNTCSGGSSVKMWRDGALNNIAYRSFNINAEQSPQQ